MGGEYLSLSPGEEERYYQETSRRLRCQRLHQVRQKEDILARERRQRYQRQARAEEKAFKTVEVRAQLVAKRAQLEGLLELRRACEARAGAAMREAELAQAEADAQRAAASAAEALRREEEAVRGLRAARVQRAAHSAQQRRAVEEMQRASEVAAAERKRAQRAASLGRMAQAAKELVRREAEHRDVKAASAPTEVVEAATELPRRAPRPTPEQRKAARARSAAAWRREEVAKCEEASARTKAEDARKERMQKISAVAEAAAEAAEAAQPRHGPVEEAQEVSLCEDCKEMRAELERLLSYRTLSPRELKGPSNSEQPPAPCADAESASPIVLEESLHDLGPPGPGSDSPGPEHTLRVLDFGQESLAEVLRHSCQSSESEGVELPATSAQVLLPGAEVFASDPLDSQSCAEPFSTSPEDHPALSDEIPATDLFDESTDEVKGTSPSASVWTGLPGPVLEVPSSCDAESSDETPRPLSSPVRLRPKEDPPPHCPNPGPGCGALSASFDSESGRRFGEEDLSRRLDEICRQLDAVF
ncbi:unnamed protein product [Symbiodinium sp. CCMP2456]|nr:unnamed protein product [Symbiodinium sp. CCMP2456]